MTSYLSLTYLSRPQLHNDITYFFIGTDAPLFMYMRESAYRVLLITSPPLIVLGFADLPLYQELLMVS